MRHSRRFLMAIATIPAVVVVFLTLSPGARGEARPVEHHQVSHLEP